LADAVSAAENWSSRHAKEMKDKGQLETEIALLNRSAGICVPCMIIQILILNNCKQWKRCKKNGMQTILVCLLAVLQTWQNSCMDRKRKPELREKDS